ncbi:MAG: hypothetical protein J0L75_03820 [Spirochaetes bacterium]|nr:hypothetical protein [Spirochaetota bacterium]
MNQNPTSPAGAALSAEKAQAIKAKGVVEYADFGAVGDGKTDDIEAIFAAHAFANEHRLPVKADGKATYYIGGKGRTVEIMTDTDFNTAAFVIDDTQVENRNLNIFAVSSTQKATKPGGIVSLKRGQEKVSLALRGPSLVTVTNSKVKRYIRFGANQNSGAAQTDIFQVDVNGVVDPLTPILWDFDEITDLSVLPMDESTLRITGGRFTTIANQEASKYSYYARGILIRRSNVIVDGLSHLVTGEGESGAPYGGFISVTNCAKVTVQNTVLTGHKIYNTIGSAGRGVSMGTYDINVNRALNVSFVHCKQSNDIHDPRYWGIMGSNFGKNLVYDHCIFSRFDAHMGVANATIRHSTLGHQGINLIGSGRFILEHSTVCARSLVNLRPDYGSTWQGELTIRDCVFKPGNGKPMSAALVGGSNAGQHDFGYTCYMPERITIENLQIDDSQHPDQYDGPALFDDFNPKMTDESYEEKYPYVLTKEVILKKVSTASGKEVRVCNNPFMFRQVKVVRED